MPRKRLIIPSVQNVIVRECVLPLTTAENVEKALDGVIPSLMADG